MFKKENGITLVALIITIVILLILAGVSIATLSNTNLFGKSRKAVNAYKSSEIEQNEVLNDYEHFLNEYLNEYAK